MQVYPRAPCRDQPRRGSRGNFIYEGRKFDGVSKDDVQGGDCLRCRQRGEDLLSWHGLLAQAEIDRLREVICVEHEEHEILVEKCNELIAAKKQERDGEAEREVATDGGVNQPTDGAVRSKIWSWLLPQGWYWLLPMGRMVPSFQTSATKICLQTAHFTATFLGVLAFAIAVAGMLYTVITALPNYVGSCSTGTIHDGGSR